VIHECANPDSSSLFRNLGHGKLFLLDRDIFGLQHLAIRRERFRMSPGALLVCDSCSSLLTLTFERGRGMATVPIPVRNTPASVLHLRHGQPALKSYRAELKGGL
jgi:hypothetical protein